MRSIALAIMTRVSGLVIMLAPQPQAVATPLAVTKAGPRRGCVEQVRFGGGRGGGFRGGGARAGHVGVVNWSFAGHRSYAGNRNFNRAAHVNRNVRRNVNRKSIAT